MAAGKVSLRVLAALLAYPDARLRGELAGMMLLLARDGALSGARLAELDALAHWLADGDPLDVEAEYVETFDRGRATSLHLFEHVHGDSRERGPAMIDLARTYAAAGLMLKEGELPDFLPVVLEFASTQPAREARAFLGEIAHLVNAIFGALLQRGSRYAAVMGALLDVAGEQARAVELPPEPALDESWAEPPAFDSCSVAGQGPQPVRIVRKMSPKESAP
jgi:nitrate reductase delta subunit